MEITTMTDGDGMTFLRLARAEGWRIPSQELRLFRANPGCTFALREDDQPLAFVSVLCHQRSGWIGNLMVAPGDRRRGHGSMLFSHAVDVLRRRGAQTLWLTASPKGRGLYERSGFREVDQVVRWALRVPAGERSPDKGADGADGLYGLDEGVWGESRRPLLAALAAGGRIFRHGQTAALLQAGERTQVLGPWVSADLCPRGNRLVLTSVLGAATGGAELVTDVLASSPVQSLLLAAGFEPCGQTALMANGPLDGVDLGALVSLASLGSMG